MRRYLIGAALLTIIAASCNKDKDMKKATVIDTGDIALDGCGYVLQFDDGTQRKPKYLPSTYTHDGYKVKVKYNSDGEGVICHTHPTNQFVEVIEIVDIKKDLD